MSAWELVTQHAQQWLLQLAEPTQRVAFAAAALAGALVIVSAFVKTIMPLRWLAVAGNLGFVVYGLAHPAPMVAALHGVLLPINLWRVLEMRRLTRRVRQAEAGGPAQIWLQPYMRRRRLRPGAVLFERGAVADRLYVLAEGQLELVETGRLIEPGQMFGEIAFFAPDRRRTGTVRCVVPSTVLSIDETQFRQIFFQNPGFGFEIVRLVVGRMGADVAALRHHAYPEARGEPDAVRDVA